MKFDYKRVKRGKTSVHILWYFFQKYFFPILYCVLLFIFFNKNCCAAIEFQTQAVRLQSRNLNPLTTSLHLFSYLKNDFIFKIVCSPMVNYISWIPLVLKIETVQTKTLTLKSGNLFFQISFSKPSERKGNGCGNITF